VNLVEPVPGLRVLSGLGRVTLPRMCTNADVHARVFLRKTLAARPFQGRAASEQAR